VEEPVPKEVGSGASDQDGSVEGSVEIVRFQPEQIQVRCKSPGPAILVLAESWFPGWHASINGQPARCFPANAWMRAAVIPAGTSDVTFAYRSNYLAVSTAISLATLLVLLACLRKKRTRKADETIP
jgi:uncharacterized membrane protein YfhO